MVIKSRRVRLAKCVARSGQKEMRTGILWENLKARDHFEEIRVDGMMILNGP
jgi:hypothetical protein